MENWNFLHSALSTLCIFHTCTSHNPHPSFSTEPYCRSTHAHFYKWCCFSGALSLIGRLKIKELRARTHWANFCLFCEKICHQFAETSAPGDFYIYQILSRLTKLQRRRRPASEQDKFLSGVKTVQILQFARHDLKKKFLSAPTIWQRQILSRFLAGPNKFCQSSASGP